MATKCWNNRWYVGVKDGFGLILWKTGFVLLVCIVLPLDLWLLPQTIAKTACWGSFPSSEKRDPYCLCFDIDDNREDFGAKDNCCTHGFCTYKNCCGYIFLKKVAIKLFILFESVVHLILSSGRFLFFMTSSTNLMFAFGDFTFVSGVMLVVIDGLSFLVKSVQFYYTMPCCSNRVCTKYSVFTVLSFYISAAALFCSSYNFLVFSFDLLHTYNYDIIFDHDEIFLIFAIALPCSVIAFMIFPVCICCACMVCRSISCKP